MCIRDRSQVSVADGHLRLKAEARSSTVEGVTYPYTSGVVQSRGNFEYQYGYVEFRMNVPADQGYWPSAWLVGSVHEMAEIDIAEFLRDRNGRYGPMMNVHWGTDWDSVRQWGLKSVGEPKGSYGGSWHTYGSVSYTHLKEKVRRVPAAAQERLWNALCTPCLLYTSRCV